MELRQSYVQPLRLQPYCVHPFGIASQFLTTQGDRDDVKILLPRDRTEIGPIPGHSWTDISNKELYVP